MRTTVEPALMRLRGWCWDSHIRGRRGGDGGEMEAAGGRGDCERLGFSTESMIENRRKKRQYSLTRGPRRLRNFLYFLFAE